jgi:hypothetical protein
MLYCYNCDTRAFNTLGLYNDLNIPCLILFATAVVVLYFFPLSEACHEV